MKLELEILALLKQAKRPLHWVEIRNELAADEEYKQNPESFSVKLSRALKRMQKDEILMPVSTEHKNVTYDLNPNYKKNFRLQIMKQERLVSILDSILDSVFIGTWEPGISFESLKKRAWNQWREYFERNVQPQLKSFWEANQEEE